MNFLMNFNYNPWLIISLHLWIKQVNYKFHASILPLNWSRLSWFHLISQFSKLMILSKTFSKNQTLKC